MSDPSEDIVALEKRLSAALERIRAGIGHLGAKTPETGPDGSDEVAGLVAELASEKETTAKLTEEVAALQAMQDGKFEEVAVLTEKAKGQLTRYEKEVQRLKAANAELRDINSKLRDAMQADLDESAAALVNEALQAELSSLRAVRAADAAEVDAVLADLKPIIEGAR